jgi:hypothetical protein
MAGFCTKCGSQMPSETGFCPACGTPAGAGSVTPQQGFAPVAVPVVPVAQPVPVAAPTYQATPGYSQVNAPPAAGYPPAAAYPVAPPTKSGGALKIILIVVALIVGLGLISGAVVGYGIWHTYKTVKDSVRMNGKGDTASVSVPGGGTMSIGNDASASSSDLGVPIYPGAERKKGGLNMNTGSVSMVMAHFTTGDSTGQVVDFYKGQMGEGTTAVATGTNNGTVLNSGGKDTNRIIVTVGAGTGDDAGKTTIVILHTQKK